MSEHPAIGKLRQIIGIVYQRAARDGRESDMVDLQHAFDHVQDLGHAWVALEQRADESARAAAVMVQEYDVLLGAVLDADETHPLVSELAEAIRQEEWAEAAADGVLSPNEWAEKLNVLTNNADPQSVAVLVRVLTGDALDSDGRVALVELIRRIAWENKP